MGIKSRGFKAARNAAVSGAAVLGLVLGATGTAQAAVDDQNRIVSDGIEVVVTQEDTNIHGVPALGGSPPFNREFFHNGRGTVNLIGEDAADAEGTVFQFGYQFAWAGSIDGSIGVSYSTPQLEAEVGVPMPVPEATLTVTDILPQATPSSSCPRLRASRSSWSPRSSSTAISTPPSSPTSTAPRPASSAPSRSVRSSARSPRTATTSPPTASPGPSETVRHHAEQRLGPLGIPRGPALFALVLRHAGGLRLRDVLRVRAGLTGLHLEDVADLDEKILRAGLLVGLLRREPLLRGVGRNDQHEVHDRRDDGEVDGRRDDRADVDERGGGVVREDLEAPQPYRRRRRARRSAG